MLDCQVAILENAISRYAATGEVAQPIGARHPSISPFAGFEAKDGWMVIAAGNDLLFQKMCEALGIPGLAKDKRFATNALRTENWEPLFAAVNRALHARTVADWLATLDAAGVPCGPINTIDKVLADPHVRARNMVVSADDPATGRLVMAGNPIKLSGFPDPETRVPAPRLDQDRDALLGEFVPPSVEAAERSRALVTSALPAAASSAAAQASRSALRLIDQLRRAVGLDAAALSSDGRGAFIERARALTDALMSERGEVLGTVIAHDLARLVRSASSRELIELLSMIATRYAPDAKRIAAAADAWRNDPSERRLAILSAAVEAPRQELFRRINMAPDGTSTLVDLREFALSQLPANPDLAPVEADLKHLFDSWFNRGFLELRRIDWHTSAAVLEKLIDYEAVHAIDGWDDLRRRLASDRRCFAFFHPALPDDPLIFIEVALVDELSARVEPIIRAPLPDDGEDRVGDPSPSTAIFYSISNCQPGLKGVSFGNFLIKQVAADLARELPSLTTFSTLSPIPTLRAWIEDPATQLEAHLPRELAQRLVAEAKAKDLREAIATLGGRAEADGYAGATLLRDVLLRLGARYVAGTGTEKGPRDPVARFHLGNGARIERVNWMADLSRKGVRESYGLMVNYLYDLDTIESNHEAFANRRPVAASKRVADLIEVSETGGLTRSLFDHVDAAIGLRGRKG
jgi:malonyl-CoA decarboxylase